MEQLKGLWIGQQPSIELEGLTWQCVSHFEQAKIVLSQSHFDLCLLVEQPTLQKAVALTGYEGMEVAVVIGSNYYDQWVYQSMGYPLWIFAHPLNEIMFDQWLHQLLHIRWQRASFENRIRQLENQMVEHQRLNQMKFTLMEHYGWTEAKAHHYLSELAMKTGKTKHEIIEELERMFRHD